MATLKKIIRSKVILTLVAVLILYTLAGFFLAPYLVTRLVPGMVAEKLHAELRMGAVKTNPFLLTFQADDVVLHEPDGTLVAGFRQCFIDFETSSLLKWALVFKTVRLDRPRVNVLIDETGMLNFARLVRENPESADSDKFAEKGETDTSPPRLILNQIQITEGEIDFRDGRQSVPAMIAIRPLSIELNDISTLPDQQGPYRLTASTREQELFQWTGEISLNPFMSRGRLGFSNIKLSTVWQFFRDSAAIQNPDGQFSFDTAYVMDFGQPEASLKLQDIEIRLAGLVMQLPADEPPLLELARLDINAPLVDVMRRTVDVEKILFEGGKTVVAIDGNGRFNWSRFTASSKEDDPTSAALAPEPGADAPQGKPDTPWNIKVSDVELRNIELEYQDQSRSPELRAGVTDIDGSFNFSLLSGSAGTDFKVRDTILGLNDIQIGNPQTPEPEIQIEKWRFQGGEYDFGRNTLNIEGVFVEDGNIDIRREKDGRLNIVELFIPAGTESEKTPESSGDTKGSPFQYLIRRAELANFGLVFSDQTVETDGEMVHLDNLHVAASSIDGNSQMPVALSFDIREGGHVAFKSLVDPNEPSVQADIDVESLALVPFEPYLKTLASLQVASGTLSTRGQFAYRAIEAEPKLAFKGSFDVAGLQILETGSEKTLLGWEHFQTPDLKFRLQPDRLEVTDLKLSGLDGQFIISEDGSLNLAQLFKKDADEPAKEEAQDDQEEKGPMFPIYLHKLRFENGGLFFADYSLVPQFATRIHQLDGSIIGMSSEPGARAQVQLDGRVDDFGLSKVKGEINFFDPAAFTDMSLLFRNLEMTGLTPYSGKFVGRQIDSGKLSLDLKYYIENDKLKGDNQIVIERIKLGEQVDSPNAVSLPLSLAIAILEDADGVIDIGLPVSGDLADPKFSYGRIVWKAFTNLITKLATAPFRALGALLGGDSEKLDTIMFENGSAELLAPEMEKLANLAQALERRPNLKLLIQGQYNDVTDGKELKAMQVRRHMAGRQGLTLTPAEDPGILDFGIPEVQLALEAAFTERYGAETLSQIKADMEQASAEPLEQTDAPQEAVKIHDPAALWKMLYGRLVEDEALAESVLVQLGKSRSRAIFQELNENRGISVDRIAVNEPKPLKPDQSARATLALEVLEVKPEKRDTP